jgi:hypothetical protein
MAEYVVGPGEAYTSIAAALAVVDSLTQPLTEVQQIEVKEGIALAPIVIPPGIQPTALNPLHIVNFEFHRPKVGPVTMDKPHLKVSGLQIEGDVLGGEDGQLFSENLVYGKAEFVGDGVTPRTIKVVNNVVITLDGDGIVFRDMPGGSRAIFNTILARTDLLAPVWGLVADESDLQAKYNILTALGSSAAHTARIKNTGGYLLDYDRNLYWIFGEALVGTYEDGMGVQEAATFTAWQAATGMDLASLFADPEFKCLDEDEGLDLDVSNTSPAIAQGDWDPDAEIDYEKTRRPTSIGGPLQSTTLGAYEEAQIITDLGKTRILELIGGLSSDYIGLVGVGDEGTISTVDYLKPETPSMIQVDLDHRIFLQMISRRFVIDITGYFECILGPSPRLTEELLDDKIDVMTEVGLFALDGLLFMRRTMYRIPFDPLSVITTKMIFGVSIGPCKEFTAELGPELEMTLETVPV